MKIITIVILWKAKLANQRCYKQLQTDSMSEFCAYSTQWAWSSFLTLQQCWGQLLVFDSQKSLETLFPHHYSWNRRRELKLLTLCCKPGTVSDNIESHSGPWKAVFYLFFFKTSLRVELEVDQVAVLDKGIASKAITWLCSEVVPPCSSFLLPSIS